MSEAYKALGRSADHLSFMVFVRFSLPEALEQSSGRHYYHLYSPESW